MYISMSGWYLIKMTFQQRTLTILLNFVRQKAQSKPGIIPYGRTSASSFGFCFISCTCNQTFIGMNTGQSLPNAWSQETLVSITKIERICLMFSGLIWMMRSGMQRCWKRLIPEEHPANLPPERWFIILSEHWNHTCDLMIIPPSGKNAWYEKRHVSPKKNSLPCLHFLQGKEFDYRHTCMSVRVPASRLPDITYNTMVLLSIYAPLVRNFIFTTNLRPRTRFH